jgi:hypothetical protein
VRTTVNISDSLLAEARLLAAKTRRSLGSIVDDGLRLLLKREGREAPPGEWTFPTDGGSGLQPGVNLEDKEALAELLGDNDLP